MRIGKGKWVPRSSIMYLEEYNSKDLNINDSKTTHLGFHFNTLKFAKS